MNKIDLDLLAPDYTIDTNNPIDVESLAEVDCNGKPSVNKLIKTRETEKIKLQSKITKQTGNL